MEPQENRGGARAGDQDTAGAGQAAAEQQARFEGAVARVRQEMGTAYRNFTAPDGALAKSKSWVEENPGLSLLIAAGVGVLVGTLLSAAAAPPRPPTLAERVGNTARDLARQTRRIADGATETISDKAEDVVHAVSKKAHVAAEKGSDLAEVVADAVADVVKTVLAAGVGKKVKDWVS